MSDPLGLIGLSSASRMPHAPRAEASEAGAPTFKQVLIANLRDVNEAQAEATRAVEDLTAGRRDDVEGVMLATEKADVAFRMLQAMRNKVMQAYDELRNTQM